MPSILTTAPMLYTPAREVSAEASPSDGGPSRSIRDMVTEGLSGGQRSTNCKKLFTLWTAHIDTSTIVPQWRGRPAFTGQVPRQVLGNLLTSGLVLGHRTGSAASAPLLVPCH